MTAFNQYPAPPSLPLTGSEQLMLAQTNAGVSGTYTVTLAQLLAGGWRFSADSFVYAGSSGVLASTAAATNGQLLIGSTGAAPVAATLTGTANQVIVTNGAGSITLSLPQSIATSSSPTFAAMALGTSITVGQTEPNATVIDIENPGHRSWFLQTNNTTLVITNNIPVQVAIIADTGAWQFPAVATTASAANAFLDSSNFNNLLRSTSQGKYKLDQQPLSLTEAKAISFGRKAIHYVSASESDDPKRRWIGYLAEDVGLADHRFATFDQDGTPNWVQYERFVVPHGLILEDHEARLRAIEAHLP